MGVFVAWSFRPRCFLDQSMDKKYFFNTIPPFLSLSFPLQQQARCEPPLQVINPHRNDMWVFYFPDGRVVPLNQVHHQFDDVTKDDWMFHRNYLAAINAPPLKKAPPSRI
jgi:hypothetical protein